MTILLVMTILSAIWFGTTNTNTQNNTNFRNFFKVFWKFLSFLAQGVKKPPLEFDKGSDDR